jgi:predicted nucleic acid-binding protein
VNGFLIDTNVVSETAKSRPHPVASSWLGRVDPDSVWLSVLTIGELRSGAGRLDRRNPDRAHVIRQWIEGLEGSYGERILPVSLRVARVWGAISARRTLPVVDALLAATAIAHDLTLVTRNTRDFEDVDVRLLDPFV